MISWVFQSNGIANLLFNHCTTAFNRCEGLFDYIFNFFGVTVQKCMWGAAMENAKTFSLVLNTLNLRQLPKASIFLHKGDEA